MLGHSPRRLLEHSPKPLCGMREQTACPPAALATAESRLERLLKQSLTHEDGAPLVTEALSQLLRHGALPVCCALLQAISLLLHLELTEERRVGLCFTHSALALTRGQEVAHCRLQSLIVVQSPAKPPQRHRNFSIPACQRGRQLDQLQVHGIEFDACARRSTDVK